ncbi:unnamed protein product [Rotaria sordida]|uniref:Immunoglobulin domain-containing protein n=1 Tax=Rotaria sordida TaxID=392033 RepID=A0A818MJH1_9BILA|nr:unnamed protein product [Rotaria sordida]CAF0755505.1 unnamed protein product [Rotaria sordida]CAF0875062.1 unnamed protein product [Rotaria sordida]CAF0957448.1 unnamed protein product [Rotaria sordida]CAF1012379.1 unnamed protein product [Rotaria sordida]
MECKQQTATAVAAVRQSALAGLLFSIVMVLLIVDGTLASTEAEIISTQDEIITYINHTAKLSCIIQNKNRHHITWSRITFINETQKITNLLFVDLLKYTPSSQYHLTHMIERDNREYWNLEIRNVHLSDQGYYSCVLTAIKPISKIFHVKVLENTRNPLLALRSTSDAYTNNLQRRSKEEIFSSLSLFSSSILTIFLMNIILIII